MKNNLKKISETLKSKFFFDYDMSKIVWFKAGGKASFYCLVYDLNELQIILNEIESLPYEIIGSGSNLLIRDRGFNGIILKLGKKFNTFKINDLSIDVGAGILDVNLAKFAAINNFKDFEFYSGIPGTIGGAVIMNAGCYGFETKDILNEIQIINKKGLLKKYSTKQLYLTYRNSKLPKNSIIISANFVKKYGTTEEIQSKMNYIKEKRLNSQPIKLKTSGSTFKNPKNNFAAKLIEKSGCKGMCVGDAIVSEKHANFLINKKNASAKQIEDLGSKVIDRVYKKFNIKLEWEIKIIGQ